MKADQMHKDIAKDYLAEIAGRPSFKGESNQVIHRFAVLAWILDEVQVEDNAIRAKIANEYAKLPSSFGANDSQLRKELGLEGEKRLTNVQIYAEF